jgi:hypothetical protein
VQGTAGTSVSSSDAKTTPAKLHPGCSLAAPPPAGGSPTVLSTPGGRTRSRPFGPFQFVRALFCVAALAIAAPEDPSSGPPRPRDMIQPKLPFVRAVRPRLCAELPLVYRPCARATVPLGTVSRHGPVHRLRCAALVRRRIPPCARYSSAQKMYRPCHPSLHAPMLKPDGGRSGGRVCVWVSEQPQSAR